MPAISAPDLALRVLFAEAVGSMYLGRLDEAVRVPRARARAGSRGSRSSPTSTGPRRSSASAAADFKLAPASSNAISLFTLALALSATAAGRRRSRCAIGSSDWRSRALPDPARHRSRPQADARALAGARASQLGDRQPRRRTRNIQCSLVAERRGDTVARPLLCRARRARSRSEIGDRQTEARVAQQPRRPQLSCSASREQAVGYLKDAFASALEVGNEPDAAQAVSSLAQVHLRCGAPLLAEEQARHALSILDGRDDYLDERGNAHLVLGRALLEQDRDAEALIELARRRVARSSTSARPATSPPPGSAQADAYAALGRHSKPR